MPEPIVCHKKKPLGDHFGDQGEKKDDLFPLIQLQDITEAALNYLLTSPLSSLTPAHLAGALSPGSRTTFAFLKRFPDEKTILRGVFYQTLQNFKKIHKPQTLSLKETLFEGCMDYFDLLSAHKQSYSKLLSLDVMRPTQAFLIMDHLHSLAQHILAKQDPSLRGALILRGFPLAFSYIVQLWREDETLDQSKTMATLDKFLEKITFADK